MKQHNPYRTYQYLIIFSAMFFTVAALAAPVKAQEASPQYLPTIIKAGGQTGGTPGGGGGGGALPPGATAGAFDLTMSVYNAPTGAQRTPYEQNLRYFADSVYEMSNGAHKIRRISIYSNGQFADKADIIWVASCWPNANPSSYGRRGRIEMCDDFQGENFLTNDLSHQQGGYTIGHEWGHYFYGLYDEYVGQAAPDPNDPGAPANTDVGVQNSIMNSQWRAVPVGGAPADFSWLNFSTPLNNGPGGQNAHRRVFQASGWETLTRPPAQDPPNPFGARLYYPELATAAPAAGNAPSLQLPAGQATARDKLQIVWMGDSAGARGVAGQAVGDAGSVRMIVIEKSSTMGSNLLVVQAAVAELIDEANIGDSIGLIAFDSGVSVVQPLTEITGQTQKDDLLTALQGITLGDSGAATGNATRAALEAITASGVNDFNQGVYLITDGPVTTGENLDFVIDSYIDTFVLLYAFGYGVDDETEERLQEVEETGGEYRFIDPTNLDDAFDELLDGFESADQDLSPIIDVNIQTGFDTLAFSESFSTTFPVDSTLSEIEVELFYDGPLTATIVNLFDPVLMPVPIPSEDCETVAGVKTFCSTVIDTQHQPFTGTWTLEVFGNFFIPVDVEYWVGGVTEGNKFYDAEAETLDGEEIDVGNPIVLDAAVFNENLPITDVDVTTFVEKPDGQVIEVTMTDDGMGTDDIAADGVYSGEFTDTNLEGDYYIIVEFDNSDGTATLTEHGVLLALRNGETAVRAPETTVLNEAFERFAELQVTAEDNSGQ